MQKAKYTAPTNAELSTQKKWLITCHVVQLASWSPLGVQGAPYPHHSHTSLQKGPRHNILITK